MCKNLIFLRLVLRNACPYFALGKNSPLKLEVYRGFLESRLGFLSITYLLAPLRHFWCISEKYRMVQWPQGPCLQKNDFSGFPWQPLALLPRQSNGTFQGTNGLPTPFYIILWSSQLYKPKLMWRSLAGSGRRNYIRGVYGKFLSITFEPLKEIKKHFLG